MSAAQDARREHEAIPYPKYPSVQDAAEAKELHRQNRALYHQAVAEVEARFKLALEREHGIDDWGVTLLDGLFSHAWSAGHASGYEEVANLYAELVELARIARNEGWEEGRSDA